MNRSEPHQSHGTLDNLPGDEASEPWFLGPIGEEILGWLHGCNRQGGMRVGVVICGTLGPESLSTHRALRTLAQSFARHDIASIRFDYSCTGNSVDSLDGRLGLSTCVDNVRTALRAIRSRGKVDRVYLVGVRLGAVIAVKAAELEEIDGLVMWGPVVSGKRFVREWSMLARNYEIHAAEGDDESVHAAGFSLDKKFLDELAECSLLEAKPLGPPACLVVEREELPPEDKLVGRFEALGSKTERIRPGGFLAGMISETHLSKVPIAAIEAMQDWIARQSRAVSHSKPMLHGAPLRMTQTAILPVAPDGGTFRIRERFLDRSDTGGLFGVVSEPEDSSQWNGQCIILLNSGSIHHIGPNRMHVTLARRLAAIGVRVCRADLAGLGESEVRAGAKENNPYPEGAVEDVERLVRAVISRDNCSRIALAGLCSGAWASFHGGLLVDGVTDIVLINPDFYGERSVVGKPPSFVRPKDYSHYKHAARSWTKWKKLLRGQANFSKIARVLWNQVLLVSASWRTRMAGERHRLDADLTQLAISGVRVLFIFSPGDGGVDFLRMHGPLGLERLRESGLLREVTIAGSDHTFSARDDESRLVDTLLQWLR